MVALSSSHVARDHYLANVLCCRHLLVGIIEVIDTKPILCRHKLIFKVHVTTVSIRAVRRLQNVRICHLCNPVRSRVQLVATGIYPLDLVRVIVHDLVDVELRDWWALSPALRSRLVLPAGFCFRGIQPSRALVTTEASIITIDSLSEIRDG